MEKQKLKNAKVSKKEESIKKEDTFKKTNEKEQIEKKTTKKDDELKKMKEPKVDYKAIIAKLEEQIVNLKISNINLESENQKNLTDFQQQAKSFQSKAQEQINAKNKEMISKLDKDKAEFKKYGSQKLLEAIIEPILNIEQAVEAGKKQEAVSAYVMGFEMLLNQLYSELKDFGVSTIEAKSGDIFNPELHFAMRVEEGGEANTIKELKKKGFKLHDRVIKPATIIVFK